MRTNASTRGSALIISLVIVVLVAGIGGAFLADSLRHTKDQRNGIDADEAMTMCDAGMERARQALDFYRGYGNSGTLWTWDQILTYCSARPTDAVAIKNEYLAVRAGAQFTSYQAKIWSSNPTQAMGANNMAAAQTMPPNPTSPAASDPTANNVFIGWPVPFQNGAIYIHITNNDDTAGGGSPTHDVDGQVLITVTAVLPSGILRQVEGVFKQPDPVNLTLAGPALGAVVSKDVVKLLGNVEIDGRDYDQNGNLQANQQHSAPGVLTEKTVDMTNGSGTLGGNNGTGGGALAPSGAVGNGQDRTPPAGTVVDGSMNPAALPTTPDDVFGLPPGTLKAIAQAQGTYFDGSPGKTYAVPPGGWNGKVVYVDYDMGNGNVDIGGSTFNANPSVLIFHTEAPAAPSVAKNLKGSFKGLLIADAIDHTSAPSAVLGQVQMLSPTSASAGNAFGNANTPIHFSYDTLQNLPKSGSTGNTAQPGSLVSFRMIK
jgi:hypothetical protein